MTTIEALNKIKAMFAEMPKEEKAAEEPVSVDYKEYVLKDGTKVKIDKLEVGGKVVLVDDAGQESPAPVGEHELADGSKVVLDESGTIVEIKMPEAQPEVEDEVEEDMTSKKIAEMEQEIDALKKKKKEQEMKLAALDEKFSKAVTQLTDVIVGLANVPSTTPTSTPKEKFNKFHEDNKAQIERFLELAKKLK